MDPFKPSFRMTRIDMPPIARIMSRVREIRASGSMVFSMAQAVPWYTPPREALDELESILETPLAHGYGPDPGLDSTREAVAADFSLRRGIDLDWERELHLTCGASQAYLGALLACCEIDDPAVVIEPYYFDHVFAVQFGGMRLVSVPMIERRQGWGLPRQRLSESVVGASALTLVNPGNPTGCVLSREELDWLISLTRDSGCFLIIDETYERFNFTGSSYHPWEEEKPDHVITFGSFSKSFGMAGWRLGYLFGPASILDQAIKVQDSVVICPPTPAQLLLEKVIGMRSWVDEMKQGVQKRLAACRKALGQSRGLEWRETGGGFFTLARDLSGRPSMDRCMELLEEYHIATIPGSAFGKAGEGHLRISFGCLPDDRIDPAMTALTSVR